MLPRLTILAVVLVIGLAADGTVFRWASDLIFFGGSLFAASFVALLLHYPRRMAPSWAGMGVVVLYVVWCVMQQVDVFESKIFARRFLVMVGLAATFGLAALQWFLLSWVLGTGVLALFDLLPQTFGVDTTPVQGYAFLLFLLHLFFLFGMHLSSGTSLALLICGVVWLPLRAWVWGRFTAPGERQMVDVFGKVMDIALSPPGGDDQGRGGKGFSVGCSTRAEASWHAPRLGL
jgi:hypothetical protein